MANLQLTLIEGGTAEQSRQFSVSTMGCSIGRSKDCDWVLIDPDRFISNKHVLISFRDSDFFLTDLSSNGVFINGSPEALGKGNLHQLCQNDSIILGKFHLKVSAVEINVPMAHAFSAPITARGDSLPASSTNQDAGLLDIVNSPVNDHSPARPANADTTFSPPQNLETDKPKNEAGGLGLFDILDGSSESVQSSMPAPGQNSHSQQIQSSSNPPGTANANFQADKSAYPPSGTLSAGSKSIIPDDWDLSVTDEPKESAPAALKEEQTPSTPPVPQHDTADVLTPAPAKNTDDSAEQQPSSDFFERIYDSLHLPPEYKNTVDQAAFADDLVRILNTSTQGIMALLAGRSVFKQESRLNMTMIKTQSNNPIKFSLDPSDTLEMLLVKKRPGYMSAQEAYSEALNDIQAHQMAFIAGLQATLKGIVDEMNPEQIESEANIQLSSFIGINKNGRKWQVFVDKQDKLQKQVHENLNVILSAYFSNAYEEHIKKAKQDER